MSETMLTAALVIFVYVNLVHLVALYRKDNGLMDGAWGPGFLLVALFTLDRTGDIPPRQILLTGLTAVWALRLAAHILVRNAGRREEDFRYRNWRMTWGRWFYVRSYFQIYMLQGAVMFVVSLPIQLVNANSGGPLGPVDAAGVAIWLLGFFFEAAGDYQLLKFMRTPGNRGRVMRQGVWRFTRHPNYFGEAALWWGCFAIALNVPGGAWALASPLLIGFLLLRVSGVPMLEEKYKDNPEYREYRKTTNAFIPWFPRRS